MCWKKFCKRLLTAALAAAIFMTDQSISYAVEMQGPEESPVSEESPGPEGNLTPEEILKEEGTPVSEKPSDAQEEPEESEFLGQEVWNPVFMDSAGEEELFWEQSPLNVNEEETYIYDGSYGKQLDGTLAGELYKQLTEKADDGGTQETAAVSLGSLYTPSDQLAGEDYEAFKEVLAAAAQNAFDAFWYDRADVSAFDREGIRLVADYAGTVSENGGVQWSAEAEWMLPLEETESEENAADESEESIEESKDCYDSVCEAYADTAEILERDKSSEMLADDTDGEEYARIFKSFCDRKDVECVLIKGSANDSPAVWNAVRMDDGNWYAVDVIRNVLLAGSGSGEEGQFGTVHLAYGDFSNSHNGFFVYPELCGTDYKPAPEEGGSSEDIVEDMALETEEPSDGDEETETAAEDQSASEEDAKEAQPAEQPPKDVQPNAADPILKSGSPLPIAAEKTLNVKVDAVKAQLYTGKAITPKVKVKDPATNKTLKLNKQYSVSYENNVNAGTATIIIRGISGSGYDGVARVKFTIQQCDVSRKVSGKVVGKGFSYTGQTLTPAVSLKYKGMVLVQGKDYQLRYGNNVAKGNAQIYVTGMGNYCGTKVIKFKIAARKMKEVSASLSASSAVFSNVKAMPAVSVRYSGKTCIQGVDYTVKYPSKLKPGKNTITVAGKGSFTGSVKLVYTVTKAPLQNASVNMTYAWRYTKGSLKPLPSSVKVSGVQLAANKDYTVKYQDSAGKKSGSVKKAGFYKIILTGKGNYQGTLAYDFCVTEDQNVLNHNYDSAQKPANGNAGSTTPPPDTSPGDKVAVEKDRYWGYYEGYKISSKKGIQGVSDYTLDLGVQHVLLNVDIATLVSTTQKAGYIPYTYKGKTYYFGDLIALKNTIYYLHGWGPTGAGEENPYGVSHHRNVSLVLLMSWSDELSFLIHPSARAKGHKYYTLNMKEERGRETLEALFRYMGEELGQLKYRVSDWTLGNEVNSCREWNYSGNMSLNDCVANYAQAFQLLNKGVKRAATSSKVFISLDHCWNKADAGHKGKDYLDQFAAYMNQTAPDMQWNVNYHPYSATVGKAEFWSDSSNTTDDVATKYISMKNIKVLTDYLSTLESRYKKQSGSIRVSIGELGYTASQGNTSEEAKQAAALGYGYYIAMFNKRIDSYIIRAYLDAPEERLSLGLMNKKHEKKESYDVYKNLDTKDSGTYMDKYLPVVGLKSWDAIDGFDAGKLAAVDF